MRQPTSLHWYPWFAGDWRRSEDVRTMTMEQRGLYRELLDEQWETGSLPAKPDVLARLVGASAKEWARCWPAVSPKFILNAEGRLVNPRMAAVREAQRGRYQVFHNRAAKAADSRWGDASSGASSTPSSTTSSNATSNARSTVDLDLDPEVHPPPTPPSRAGRLSRASSKAALRAIGPAPATWREACPHEPTCGTPSACDLLRARVPEGTPA